MMRRDFVKNVAALSAVGSMTKSIAGKPLTDTLGKENKTDRHTAVRPRAISMWDFSWIERRWPGAGYENWDVALDELMERGYNAVRIDAFPHLVADNQWKEWTLHKVWGGFRTGAVRISI
ncbi:MAG: cellulase-like family protein [candidate division KSB1 bacterium]|nr:cellulase-like family protein [candidate division KSB1 bacterium]